MPLDPDFLALQDAVNMLRSGMGAQREQIRQLQQESARTTQVAEELLDRMDALGPKIDALDELLQARQEQERDREVLRRLQAAGVDVPEEFLADGPVTAVRSTGWVREALELAATKGGARVLSFFAVVLLGPDAVHLGTELLAVWRMQPPAIEAPADLDALPDVGPQPVDLEGPSADSPVSPRPNL